MDAKKTVNEVVNTSNAVLAIMDSLSMLLMHLGSLGKNGNNTVAYRIGHTIGTISPIAHSTVEIGSAVAANALPVSDPTNAAALP